MAHTTISSRGEYLACLDHLLGLAQQRIRIADQDLQQQGWDTPARAGDIRRFLLADRQRRLDILLQNDRFLLGHCPHLMQLLRDHAHQVEIRIRGDEPVGGVRCYTLADDRHVLQRFDVGHWRGSLCCADPLTAAPYLDAFHNDWSRQCNALGFKPLGL